MHRSASLFRASDDESFVPMPLQQMKGSNGLVRQMEMDQLPKYDPLSYVSKKEMVSSGCRTAANAVHVIPLVLFLCALILWSFSHPVDVVNKDDSNVIESVEVKMASDANQILPDLRGIKDSDEPHQIEGGEAARALEEKPH